MNNKAIINLIETTLEEKQLQNINFIRYSFYELRVKYNLSEQETNLFLTLIKNKLEKEDYQIYFTGAKFEYNDSKMMVQDNELMIAIKENNKKM